MHRGLLAGFLLGGFVFGSFSSSTHYKLQSYGVNSGGTNSSASATYTARAAAGEISGQSTSGPTYKNFSGSTQAAQASVPPAPSVDNGSSTYYNKLHFVITNTANPSDATFAVAISTTISGTTCTSPSYIQASGASSSTIVWQNYTTWGGAGGTFATGLLPGTTYYFCVAAQEGKFTASALGPDASVATVSPSLTFSVSPSPINMSNLNAGSIITSPTITFSYTTNAANGGFIYMAGSQTGLVSSSNSNYNIHVTPPSQDLASINEGSGLQATGTASLIAQSPYTSTGTTVGAFFTTFQPIFIANAPVTTGSPTAVVLAKAQVTTPAGTDYTDTLTFVAAASY